MQSNWHVIEMEYVFLNILLIVVQLYYGNVPKDIYGLHHLAMLNIQTRGVHSDFLKILKYYQGLELDIPYYDYGFGIEVQGEQHKKFNKFFHRGDPNNFIKQQDGINSKKNMQRKLDCLKACLVL
ncbi:hypothetical protein C1646_729596 [Rhizophagus diaphanus]|nr:hypothetical protein C1646_729596 [Rhizophagus diaphanus] [Rhizophagus sp. MUCL 43196]